MFIRFDVQMQRVHILISFESLKREIYVDIIVASNYVCASISCLYLVFELMNSLNMK